jgi:hypothetical protein
LPPQALRLLWDDFEDVTEDQLLLGKRVWNAVTSASPEALAEIVRAGTPALPTMGPALGRHIRELPSLRNSLSLTEQLTLKILSDKGGMTAARLWGWYNGHYEPLPFMGDSGYWRVIGGLSNAGKPALSITNRRAGSEDMDWSSRVELLPFGERLLRNQADWLAANPAERWVGGVHIDSREKINWRFDEDNEVVCRR